MLLSPDFSFAIYVVEKTVIVRSWRVMWWRRLLIARIGRISSVVVCDYEYEGEVTSDS
jgi:hypothetical protein